jgi:hypothetical protein
VLRVRGSREQNSIQGTICASVGCIYQNVLFWLFPKQTFKVANEKKLFFVFNFTHFFSSREIT